MNIQDYLNRYRNKKLNMIATELFLNTEENTMQGITIRVSNGFGVQVDIKVSVDTDLDNLFEKEVNHATR